MINDTDEIWAACDWPTNGHMIADVAKLGYIKSSDITLDTTYGRGVFWNQWKPDHLVAMGYNEDPQRATPSLTGDFTSLPFRPHSFDVVVFDAPYMPKGTTSEKLSSMDSHYGVGGKGRQFIENLLTNGFDECLRVCKPGGTILTKAGRGVDSNKLFRGDDILVDHGEQAECEVITQFLFLSRPRTQKHRGPQKSPRSNFSTLTIWRTPKAVL